MSDHIEWLRLSEAASRLGVHPTTLRRWADDGEIPSSRTPGGHRRFAVSDLEAFQRNQRKLKVIGGLEQGLADQALTQTRQEITARKSWPSEIEPADREAFRKSGRELLGLTIQYVALGAGGEGLLRQAERIARQYAVRGRRLSLSLSEMLQLLLFFRDSMMEAALDLPQIDDLRPEANQRLFRRMSDVLNAFQLAVVETYEEASRAWPGAEQS